MKETSSPGLNKINFLKAATVSIVSPLICLAEGRGNDDKDTHIQKRILLNFICDVQKYQQQILDSQTSNKNWKWKTLIWSKRRKCAFNQQSLFMLQNLNQPTINTWSMKIEMNPTIIFDQVNFSTDIWSSIMQILIKSAFSNSLTKNTKRKMMIIVMIGRWWYGKECILLLTSTSTFQIWYFQSHFQSQKMLATGSTNNR